MTLNHRTNRILYVSLAASALLLTTAPASAVPPAPPKSETEAIDDNAQVRILFRKSLVAFEAKKYEEARQLLKEAWAIRQTYDVASSLAQVEIKLRHDRDAAEQLAFCLSHFAPVESEQTLDQVRKAFADVKQRVAAIRVSTNRDGADIFVDGVLVGTAPLPSVIFVDPGARTFAARLGADSAEQTLNAEAGKEYEAQLSFAPSQTAKSAVTGVGVSSGLDSSPSKTPAPSTPHPKPNWTPVFVTGGLAVVAAVVGTGFALDARSAKSDGEKKLSEANARFGPYPCSHAGPSDAVCGALKDDQDRRHSSTTIAKVSFVASGVFAASAIASYFIWARPRVGDSHVAGWVGPGGAGIGLEGQF